jgi:hypothetical protein
MSHLEVPCKMGSFLISRMVVNFTVRFFYCLYCSLIKLKYLSTKQTTKGRKCWELDCFGAWFKMMHKQMPLILTLSGQMSIYNRHGDCASMDKCRYMIDKVCFEFLHSYVTSWHCRLYQRMHECFVCLLLLSGSHNLNFLRNECDLYFTVHQCYQHGFTYRQTSTFSHEKNGNIILCVSRMKNLLVVC